MTQEVIYVCILARHLNNTQEENESKRMIHELTILCVRGEYLCGA